MTIADNAAAIALLDNSVNSFWTMFGVVLVFWMHAGFSLLEAGSIRAKNVQNILFKNLLNVMMTTLYWWFYGYAFAFGGAAGGDRFIGGKSGYADASGDAGFDYYGWIFQWAFAATSVTIISGGMAERANSYGYILLIFWFNTIIYPVTCSWVWGTSGWLGNHGFLDFAGSAVVHAVGGCAALVGCYFLGPRKGEPEAHSPLHVVLGTFILWMGWFGFNGASGGIHGSGCGADGASDCTITVGITIMNTTLAASVGGLAVLFFFKFVQGKWVLCEMCNGILAGLVAITAPCAYVTDWASVVIGLVGAGFYLAGKKLLDITGIDDAIGAFPVHGCGGIAGIVTLGFFHTESGWFYGPFSFLGWQLIGIVSICAWVMAMTAIVIVFSKWIGILRVDEDTENVGLDAAFH